MRTSFNLQSLKHPALYWCIEAFRCDINRQIDADKSKCNRTKKLCPNARLLCYFGDDDNDKSSISGLNDCLFILFSKIEYHYLRAIIFLIFHFLLIHGVWHDMYIRMKRHVCRDLYTRLFIIAYYQEQVFCCH